MEVDLIGNLALPTGLRSDMLGALDRASLEAHDLVLRGVDLVRSFMRRTQARIFVVVGDGVERPAPTNVEPTAVIIY